MIPDYFGQIQEQISSFKEFFKEDLTIESLYDDQICCCPVTPEIYNYLIYQYICLGHNDLYTILDLQSNPILLVPNTEDPKGQDFIPLHIFLETPYHPITQLEILVSKPLTNHDISSMIYHLRNLRGREPFHLETKASNPDQALENFTKLLNKPLTPNSKLEIIKNFHITVEEPQYFLTIKSLQ